MNREFLFNGTDILTVLRGREDAVGRRVEGIEANAVLSGSEQDLVEGLVDEFRVDVPAIAEEEIYIANARETRVDVSGDPGRMVSDRSKACYVAGTETTIAVPFRGDAEWFRVRPQSYALNPTSAEIGTGEILLRYVRTDHDGEALKREYQKALSSIKDHLRSLAESAAQFNGRLESLAAAQVKARKERLLAGAGMTAAIGLPLKKREGTAVTYSVPVRRRAARIEQIQVEGAFKPEPALAGEDYEEILRIMKNMVRVMELSPRGFYELDEEALRWHFLVQLNGVFDGQATGETFNFEGRTDILIRVDGKNIFVAECKFWHGGKGLSGALDQLLSYLHWRDTKAALLIFNRNDKFSTVLASIAEGVPAHPQFKRRLEQSDESTFRYVFGQRDDPNREIFVTVLAFHVPSPPAKPVTRPRPRLGRGKLPQSFRVGP